MTPTTTPTACGRRRGRPSPIHTGWDPATGTWDPASPVARALDSVELGCPYVAAAGAAGIHRDTLAGWRRRGEEVAAVHGLDPLDDDARHQVPHDERGYFDFLGAFTRAEAAAEVRLVELWAEAAASDWRAARDLLARRWPERWANREHRTISGPEGGPVDLHVDQGVETDDELVATLAALEDAGLVPEGTAAHARAQLGREVAS